MAQIYYTLLIFSSWFRILIGLDHVTCRATFCNVTWQVMLPSQRHLTFFISVSSQGTAKFSKVTVKTQINLIFKAGWLKISLSAWVKLCVVLSNRDWSLYGDACTAICRLHTDSILTFPWPISFYLFIFVIKSNNYRYTPSSLTANEIKTQCWSVFILFFHIANKKY